MTRAALIAAEVVAREPPWKWTTDEWLGFGLRVAVALAVGLLVTVIGRRYVRHARRQAKEAGDEPSARKLRRQVTVVSLAATTAIVIVWFVVLVSILTWMGVSIGPLIASAGIAGVALGFGAQTLVRDTISGTLHPVGGPVRRGRHRRSRDRRWPRVRHDRGAHAAHHLRAAVRRDAQHRARTAPSRSPATRRVAGVARSWTCASPWARTPSASAPCSRTCSSELVQQEPFARGLRAGSADPRASRRPPTPRR